MPIPVAQAGPKQYANYSTLPRLTTLTGTATNAPILEWEWRMLSVPNGSTANLGVNGDFTAGVYSLLGPALPPVQFTCDVQGSYVLQLRARNATGWSDPLVDKAIGQTIIVIRTQKLSLTIPSSYEYNYGQPDLNASLLAIENALGGPLMDLQQAYDNNPTANPAILFTDKGFVVQDANPTIGAAEILLGAKGPAGTQTYFAVKGDGTSTFDPSPTQGTAILFDIADPGAGQLGSHGLRMRTHNYADFGGGMAHHTVDWVFRAACGPTAPDMGVGFYVSIDGAPESVQFAFGFRDGVVKSFIQGPPDNDLLVTPGLPTSPGNGRDLYLNATERHTAGTNGIIFVGESKTSSVRLGASSVPVTVIDKLGIGTLTPGVLNGVTFSTVKLHQTSTDHLYETVETTTANKSVGILFNRGGASANLRLWGITSRPCDDGAGANTSSMLQVETFTDAGVNTPWITVKRSGAVGVSGIPTGTHIFEVFGSTGSSYIDQYGYYWTTGGNATFGATGTGVVSLRLTNTGSKSWSIENTRTLPAGTLEITNLTDSPGVPALIISPVGTGRVGIGMSSAPVSSYLETPGSSTNSSLKVGSFEVQCASVNNGQIGQNVYYNGAGFRYRANGYATAVYGYNDTIDLMAGPNGVAGDSCSLISMATFSRGGAFGLGFNLGGHGDLTNAWLSGKNGKVGVGLGNVEPVTTFHVGYGTNLFSDIGAQSHYVTDSNAIIVGKTREDASTREPILTLFRYGRPGFEYPHFASFVLGQPNVSSNAETQLDLIIQASNLSAAVMSWKVTALGVPSTIYYGAQTMETLGDGIDILRISDSSINAVTSQGRVGFWAGGTATGYISGMYDNGALTLALGAGSRLRDVNIVGAGAHAGNVGFGINDPEARLHVYGPSDGSPAALITVNSSSNQCYTALKVEHKTTLGDAGIFAAFGPRLDFIGHSVNSANILGAIGATTDSPVNSGSLRFYTYAVGVAAEVFNLSSTKTATFTHAASDTLVYGGNPRLWLTCATGANGLRVDADATPFEFRRLGALENYFAVDGSMNLRMDPISSTVGTPLVDSPAIYFSGKYWSGGATHTAQGMVYYKTTTAGSPYGGMMILGTQASGLGLFVQDVTGYVGIGGTPAHVLHVYGDIFVPQQTGSAKFGVYGTISEAAGGCTYVQGNNLIASPAVANKLVKYFGPLDPGQYLAMRYDRGVYIGTGLGAGDAAGTEYDDNANCRFLVYTDGKIGMASSYGYFVPTADLHIKAKYGGPQLLLDASFWAHGSSQPLLTLLTYTRGWNWYATGDTDLMKFGTGGGGLGELWSVTPYGVTTFSSMSGAAKNNTDGLTLVGLDNAADMDGTSTSIRWRQYAYDAGAPAAYDAARITVGCESDWTLTASTQDAFMAFSIARNGTVTEAARLSNASPISTANGGSVFTVYGDTASTSTQYFPLRLTNLYNTNQNLVLGVDAYSGSGLIQATTFGYIHMPLWINSAGGAVYIGNGNATASEVLYLKTPVLSGDGVQSSHALVWTGHYYNVGSDKAVDWRAFVGVVADNQSVWHLQHRIAAVAYADRMTVTTLNGSASLQLSSDSVKDAGVRLSQSGYNDWDLKMPGGRTYLEFRDVGGHVATFLNGGKVVVGAGYDYAGGDQIPDCFMIKKHSAFDGSGAEETTRALQTTTAAQDNLWTLTLTDTYVYGMEVFVTARNTSGTERGTWKLIISAHREGGGAVLDNGGFHTLAYKASDTPAGWDVTVDTSGNDVRVRVTGAAATNINWVCRAKYQAVSGSA